MVERGGLRNFTKDQVLISLARDDGYSPPDGYSGEYTYETYSSIEKEKGSTLKLSNREVLPSPPAGGSVIYYVMRGRDVDCIPVTYRTWTVTGSPDATGSQYLGAKCGINPLTDIVVVHKYTA